MRRAITQRVASVLTTSKKCHRAFQPRREGEYLVKKCYECGEVVLADEVIGGQAFVMKIQGVRKNNEH